MKVCLIIIIRESSRNDDGFIYIKYILSTMDRTFWIFTLFTETHLLVIVQNRSAITHEFWYWVFESVDLNEFNCNHNLRNELSSERSNLNIYNMSIKFKARRRKMEGRPIDSSVDCLFFFLRGTNGDWSMSPMSLSSRWFVLNKFLVGVLVRDRPLQSLRNEK